MRNKKIVTPDGVELTVQVEGDEETAKKVSAKAPAMAPAIESKARLAANKARTTRNK